MNTPAIVTTDIRDGIAVLKIDNPPVNAFSSPVRTELIAALERVGDDPEVEAVVLIGGAGRFCGGADVTEFEGPPSEPQFPPMIALIENMTKPVVAAIAGVALGGGLEVALGCHYRVAEKHAVLGLPEVTLGIMPGAGGTVRLPRLIGAEAAVDLCTTGRRIDGAAAVSLGLVDALVDDGLESHACQFAREKLGVSPRRLSAAPAPVIPAEAFFQRQRSKLQETFKGQTSPLIALDSLRETLALPFAAAMTKERKEFLGLRLSQQAKALRHVFFAERRAPRISKIEGITPEPVERIAIVGGGWMGMCIATRFLMRGFAVGIVENDAEARASLTDRIGSNLAGAVKRGKLSVADHERLLAQLEISDNLESTAEADVIIEAAFEDMAVKKEIFTRLGGIAKPGATLASNTSYLDLDEIAAVTDRSGDVVGLHFFSPAHVMHLLEIVDAKRTSPATLARSFMLAKKLGMTAVAAGVCEGFIGNRLQVRMRQAAASMAAGGALPWDIDAAMERFGMAMGPFRVMDLVGMDIAWKHRKAKVAAGEAPDPYLAVVDRLCEAGRYGRKTGAGWYRYEDTKGVPDPAVAAVLQEFQKENGLAPKSFDTEEIQRRILLATINEGARILDEHIARRASDIDLVQIHGYGFPRWRGGPMHVADSWGLQTVKQRLDALAEEDEGFWRPAPLLADLVRLGRSFADGIDQ